MKTRNWLYTGILASLLLAALAVGAHSTKPKNFVAHLNGENEVPPVETKAQGQAKFQLNRDGDELSYKLNVANIKNVTMAHIHKAPADENGPVVAWLYPEGGSSPDLIPGRVNGVLAEGTITSDDLVGPLDDKSLEDLISAIEAGNTFVRVHTEQHPGGEIRGQIR